MKLTLKSSILVLAGLMAAPAMADHNSMWGEGTALDPMDMHSTRFDALALDDTDSFMGGRFVDHGPGLVDTSDRGGRPDTVLVDGGGSGGGQGSGRGR